jgi:heptosyltransferase III
MSEGRILVIRGGAIGDFILTLPVFSALRRQFPAVRLEVLGYPHIAALATAGGLVEAARPIEARALAGFFARKGELNAELAAYFAEFHVVISYLFDPDELFRGNLACATQAQIIQGLHRPNESRPLHATEQLLEALQRLAIFEADPVPKLNLKFPIANALGNSGGRIAIHPGSGGAQKNWPEANWAELLRRLLAKDANLLLVGGEAEGDRLERLAAVCPAGRVELARSLPLPELAGRLAGCAGFLGHDSGITHLAAALGLPGLALWGPTNATVWRPRGERFALLNAPNARLEGLATETVWNRLEPLLAEWRTESARAFEH